jgi:hypothetical protein
MDFRHLGYDGVDSIYRTLGYCERGNEHLLSKKEREVFE